MNIPLGRVAWRSVRGWISAMPTNLYGPGGNYDLASSHLLPARLRKFHGAKATGAPSVTLWGAGTPLREGIAQTYAELETVGW